MEESREKLVSVTNYLYKLSMDRRTSSSTGTQRSLDLLTRRHKDAIDMHNGIHASQGDKESNGYHEDSHSSTTVLLGSNVAVKNAVRPIKLPEVKRLPPYTTWIFLDRFVEIAYIFLSQLARIWFFCCAFLLMVISLTDWIIVHNFIFPSFYQCNPWDLSCMHTDKRNWKQRKRLKNLYSINGFHFCFL